MALRPTRPERRRRILVAARGVFGRKGYAATRMIDVAAEARVGKGTLYEHFRGGKEELFSTLVIETAREAIGALTRRGPARDPVQALRDTITYLVESVLGENLDLYCLFFDFWGVCAHREETQRQMGEIGTSFSEYVGTLVRAGQQAAVFRAEADPVELAHALSASIDGLSLRMVILKEKIDLPAYAACLQELFVGGLLAHPALGGSSVITENSR